MGEGEKGSLAERKSYKELYREPEATSFDASAPGPWPNSFRLLAYKHQTAPRGQIDVSAARAISGGKVN